MKYKIRMGIPEMKAYWDNLCLRSETGKLAEERKILRKIMKTLNFLQNNPGHNSLATHEIKPLSDRYGLKVWQSYLESKTPSAGRIFWDYGPEKDQITIIGIEPHPEDKKERGIAKSGCLICLLDLFIAVTKVGF